MKKSDRQPKLTGFRAADIVAGQLRVLTQDQL